MDPDLDATLLAYHRTNSTAKPLVNLAKRQMQGIHHGLRAHEMAVIMFLRAT